MSEIQMKKQNEEVRDVINQINKANEQIGNISTPNKKVSVNRQSASKLQSVSNPQRVRVAPGSKDQVGLSR